MTENQSSDSGRRGSPPPANRTGLLVGLAFLALAIWFWAGPDLLDMPRHQTPDFDPEAITYDPRRTALDDPPTIFLNGFDRTCNDCHSLFPAAEKTPETLIQHTHIVLNHGINDRCRNCHYDEDRNKLVLHSGEPVGYERVVELCAKCHGPIYRDWTQGIHGRTNGYWDPSRGTVKRLGCTECHDPHDPVHPAMDPLEPLPGPHTLRLAVRHDDDDAHGSAEGPRFRDPLRKAVHDYRPVHDPLGPPPATPRVLPVIGGGGDSSDDPEPASETTPDEGHGAETHEEGH